MCADKIHALYVPCVYPANLPDEWKGRLALFGLGIPGGNGQLYQPLQNYHLPFSPAEVAETLRMMHETTLEAVSGMPQALAMLASKMDSKMNRAEMRALARFMEGRDEAEEKPTADPALQAKAAHIFLLYTFFLEQRLAEIQEIGQTFREHAAQFAHALGEDEDGLAMYGLLENMEGTSVTPPAWQLVVENMGFFLAENTLLVTASPEIYADLHETQFCHATDMLPDLDFLDARTHKAWGTGFLWRALGYAQCPVNKPWLDKKISIVTVLLKS